MVSTIFLPPYFQYWLLSSRSPCPVDSRHTPRKQEIISGPYDEREETGLQALGKQQLQVPVLHWHYFGQVTSYLLDLE